MKNLIEKVNGKKTLFGSILAVIYLGSLSMGFIEQNVAVEYFITVVLGVGLTHKAVKSRNEE
jgi:hypothetical protein